MPRWVVRIVLLLVIVAAGLWLWSWSGAEPERRELVRGGALFDFTADQIAALEIRRLEGTTRLERDARGQWVLTGWVADLVDPDRVAAILESLVAGEGFAVLAGTQPDERRFGFGSEHSLELVFHLHAGGRHRLALGDANPVSEIIYASGAGRPGVFAVGGGYYAVAVRLPDSLRLPHVLPARRAADLDSLRIDRRGDRPLVAATFADERWWLRVPGGPDALTGTARRYHDLYTDRQLVRDGVVWLQADVRRLRDAVYRATETAVVIFPTPQLDTPVELAELGLLPPYRGLTLHETGGDSLRVEFGEERTEGARKLVAARREGTLVIARSEAMLPLEGALAEFLDLGALSFRPEVADSLRVDEPRRPLLWGRRADDPAERRRLRQSVWDAIAPAGWQFAFGAESAANQVADLQLNLDRLESLGILEPTAADPLRTDERWRLRAWLPGERFEEVWFGRLATDGRAAVWQPQDGKLVLVPEQTLISLRNLRTTLQVP
jgi:hypothetical protein